VANWRIEDEIYRGRKRRAAAAVKSRQLPLILIAALCITPDRAVRTDPAQTRQRPPAGSSVARNPMKIAPNAEVEVLPLIFLATGAETPGKIGILVAVSNASFGSRRTVGRRTREPDDGERNTRYVFH
jgi:hypothetical protein